MRLILLGAPGSGKGTQASRLSGYFKIKKISLGDILREEVKKGTDLGKKVITYMGKGLLVPDEIVSLLVEQSVDNSGFVLDGYPRNLNQARSLDTILEKKNFNLEAVVYLKVDKEIVIKRLSGRRVCKKCGANYHLETLPPKREGTCDFCGGELVQRDDDKPEVIEKRWEVFQEEAKSLLGYYQEKNKLITVDANGTPEQVFESIIMELKHGTRSFL